jgi:hypothetical protein
VSLLQLLADTVPEWTGPPPSVLAIAGTLLSACAAAVKVMYSAQAKTLEVERARVAELTEQLRRRNESVEERVLPALLQSADVMRVVLEQARREQRG